MGALGMAIDVELSQRPAAGGLSLMPAQTTLLVAGDSLAVQANNGAAHSFAWASRRGRFDVDYNHRLHNLGLGGTPRMPTPGLRGAPGSG